LVAGLVSPAAFAAPGTPVYSVTFSDAVTLDNEFTAADGKRYWDVDPGADQYASERYERATVQTYQVRTLPGGAQRFGASEYLG
jgi:hypothetical protein